MKTLHHAASIALLALLTACGTAPAADASKNSATIIGWTLGVKKYNIRTISNSSEVLASGEVTDKGEFSYSLTTPTNLFVYTPPAGCTISEPNARMVSVRFYVADNSSIKIRVTNSAKYDTVKPYKYAMLAYFDKATSWNGPCDSNAIFNASFKKGWNWIIYSYPEDTTIAPTGTVSQSLPSDLKWFFIQ